MYTKKKNADGSVTYALDQDGKYAVMAIGGGLVGFSLGYLAKALLGGSR